MSSESGRAPLLPLTGLFLAGLIVSTGSFWAFRPGGGHDFAVFHSAWQLVMEGRGLEIYRVSPDRYLYAPGFAWLLAPVGKLGFEWALLFWCLAKAAAVGLMVRMLGRLPDAVGVGMAGWGVVLMARPLLIDFQYGQVNTFIVGACVWALCRHFSDRDSKVQDFLSWTALAIAALAKVFPLPLLLVPFFRAESVPVKRLLRERIGVFLGLGVMVFLPVVSVGIEGLSPLLLDWQRALMSRGMPLESHNQSFSALLHHFFSGMQTSVLALGGTDGIRMGSARLAERSIELLTVGWSLLWMGGLLGWILFGSEKNRLKWLAVTVGLLIVPSHLVWKPYFVMAIPLAVTAVGLALRGGWESRLLLAAIFVALNFSGFDFLGPHLGAWMEASSIFLLMHLVLTGWVYQAKSHNPGTHSPDLRSSSCSLC